MSVSYVVDENGKRVSVILPVEEYERMVEELEDIRAAEEVRAAITRGEEEMVPLEEALPRIEEEREKLRRQGLV